MNKIMIVDDMPIFLEYLRGCIDWESYGFEICCEAHDGKEALEMMEKYYPDVVLTDITMPYLNGLELSEIIVRDYPESAIILITGNNEFEYARRAVKLGVCDYIVKPFEKEELILSLLKLKDNMGRAMENENRDSSVIGEEPLRKLLYTSGTKTEEEWTRELGIKSGFPFLTLFSFEMQQNRDRELLMNWEQIIAKMLGDKIEIDGQLFLFHDYENNLVVLQIFEKENDLSEYKGYEFADIAGVVKNQLSIDVKAVSGIPEGGLQGVNKLYDRELRTIRQAQAPRYTDLREEDDTAGGDSIPQVSLEAIARLNKDIETLNADDAEKVLTETWEIMTASGHPRANVNILTGAVGILMTNILKEGLSVEAVFGKGFSPERELEKVTDPEKMLSVIVDMYRKRIEYSSNYDPSSSKTHHIALGAKKYIEDNYRNHELSIADIASELLVNQTYLRKMFKSEIGMTLVEYITQYRMQEARRLITTTDKKLSEIAEEVGYTDVSYFSNCFKKFYGMSPRSLQKQVE